MTSRTPLVVTLIAIAAAGLAASYLRIAGPTLDQVAATKLTAIADQWWEESSQGTLFSVVPEDSWPVAVRQLGPDRVLVTAEGVYIRRLVFFVQERGWFILPTGSDFEPLNGSDPSFKHLRARVYRYVVKG